jgi:Mg2+/citrate symporter
VGLDGMGNSTKKKVNTGDELVARIMNSAAFTEAMLLEMIPECQILNYILSRSKNVKTTSGELHVLLPRELKSALKSIVGLLNTYFELL